VRALAEVAVWSVLLTGVTLVSISTLSLVESVVAVVAAVAGGYAARRVRLAAGAAPGGRRGAMTTLLLLPVAVLRGGAALTGALLRGRADGGLRRATLKPGTGPGWAGAAVAFSPDTCVVGMPRDDELLLHTLGGRPGAVERALTDEGEPG
jgi:hypothetical protein